MDITITKLEISYSIHATEDFEKNMEALGNLIPIGFLEQTEIAIDEKADQRRFVAIDYVNDQCDMTPQSQDKTGVPDYIITYVANCIVDSAKKVLSGQEISKDYTTWLYNNKDVQLRGLGDVPGPLK